MRRDIQIDIVEDRPASGMWHCGPNACWVTATHTPTGCSVRVYGEYQHKAREKAMLLLDMAIEEISDVPRFMDRIRALDLDLTPIIASVTGGKNDD